MYSGTRPIEEEEKHIKLLWDKLHSFGLFCSKRLGGDGKWHLHTCEAGFIDGVRESCEDDCAEIAAILRLTNASEEYP